MSIKDYRQLKVWQKSMDLTEFAYKITESFPKSETYALSYQIRRAAASVPLNIAEGNGQMYVKKEVSFLNNASGSASELRSAFDIASRLGYLEEGVIVELDIYCEEIIRMLIGLIKAKSEA